MKKMRIILLCMMMLLCVCLLCSCNDDVTQSSSSGGGTTTRPGQGGDDIIGQDKWNGVNFNDDVIRLQLSSYDDAELTSGAKKYMQGPDGPSSDKVQQLVYTRNKAAQDTLGLTVEYYYIDKGWGIASGTIIDTEKNAASKPDMYCDMVYDMMKATLDGCFRNLYTMTTDFVTANGQKGGYFEFEAAEGSDSIFENAYLSDFMAGLTFSSDKMYLIGSQYYIDLIRAMMVLPINIDMYDTKYGSIDQFYQDVIDGKWTWDYLMNVSQKIYNDKTGNGNTMDDILGFAAETGGGKSAAGIVYSTDINIVEVNERNGLYSFTYNANNKQLYDIFDKIAQVFSTDGVAISNVGGLQEQTNAILNAFASGTLLFGGCAMMGIVEAETYQEMEQQFGLVPIPKLSEEFEYNTLIHNVGKCGAVSFSTSKPRQISAFIQYCSENSKEVVNEYYNYAMKYKYTSDAGTAEMLDMIYQNIVSVREKALDDLLSASNSDAGTYAWHKMLIGAEGNLNYQSNADQIASVYETAIRIKQSVIGQLLKKWKNLG